MTGGDADDLRGMVRNGPSVEERVGEKRVAAVVLHLPGAVGIHVEQDPRVRVRQVGILPSQIQHAAVVQHRRAPVVLLVHGQLADRAVAIQQVEVGHVRAAVDARHADEGSGGREQNPPVGQVAGVVVVHVGLVNQRQFPQARSRQRSSRIPASGRSRRAWRTAFGRRRNADRRRRRTGRRPVGTAWPVRRRAGPATGPQAGCRSRSSASRSCSASWPAAPGCPRRAGSTASGRNPEADWPAAPLV